ncbi:Ca2+:H+ antiporter [Sphingomonas kaistensis]|uniref:Ca2+:H+ antiporter n=1 Tax=Sphingomonas kaistensis TaxID=298708 RepID=A0A7X6BG21_9SPHN|nr:ionic transporter y4hA [Sphingomonas kaistensis]NJC05994.1 Ca2+:H+ antiporter [Sphingomonas kaistensis]
MAKLGNWASIIGPLLGWALVLAGMSISISPLITGIVLIGVVIAAVHHAELVAHRVGEPFGTLILAVAVTIIEVGLILSLMLANREAASTLARDTVFAAAMIIMNLLLGLCLIAASRHQKEVRFTRTGATAALSTLATLMVLTLVLPNFTTSVAGPIYSNTQLAFVAAFSLILYLVFVFVQTVGNRDYFLPRGDLQKSPDAHAPRPDLRTTWISFGVLLISLGAVILLAKSLSGPLEQAVTSAGLPLSLVGIAIAAIVLLPEGVAAVRAARSNRLQTSLNLALGSALATIGLTIPAVTVASFALGLPLALGLDNKSVTLLALTLFIGSLSLARGRTTLLHGSVHLAIFAAYLLTTIIP